jgi:aminomethyltransferase
MKRSPLHQLNASLGARFVPFGGWEMPVQYSSVLAEHRAVRASVGVFDVTHLGRFALTGPGSHDAVLSLLCNDIGRVGPGRCQYTMMLNPEGGIIDDLIVWWWDEDEYWVMPNAANHQRVMGEFSRQDGCHVEDLQATTVFLAVQGPDSIELLDKVLGRRPGRLRNGRVEWDVGSESAGQVSFAGTGYTGEPGAELCAPPGVAAALMKSLIDAGATPCGLGARDTLRLEAGLALWGEDIDETTTPLEAGLRFAVNYGHEFVGKDALMEQESRGLSRLLTGFVLEDRGIPRHGHEVRTGSGGSGLVTSGNISPILDKGIGMAYVAPPPAVDDSIEVRIRDRWVPARIAKPPFHTS